MRLQVSSRFVRSRNVDVLLLDGVVFISGNLFEAPCTKAPEHQVLHGCLANKMDTLNRNEKFVTRCSSTDQSRKPLQDAKEPVPQPLPIYMTCLQDGVQLVEDAQEGADREDVSTGPVEVIIDQVADIEEDVLEEEVEEEPVDERGLLGGAVETGGEDEGGGEGKAGEDFEEGLMRRGESVSETSELLLDEARSCAFCVRVTVPVSSGIFINQQMKIAGHERGIAKGRGEFGLAT